MIRAETLGRIRKEVAAGSVEVFSRTYLAKHFDIPPCSMHKELFELLEGATRDRNARLAIAAPRGYAKSTLVSLAFVLWCICYQREHFVALISNTGDQSEDLLATIKDELESNPLLHEDFPEAAEPLGSKPTPKRWRRREILTKNGVRVMALGAGQKIRGRKHQQHRPTLILLDDVENEADVTSPDQRETKRVWFEKAVLKAGTTAHTNLVVVGTLLHYDSLLTKLLANPGWTSRKYQAVLAWAENDHLWQRWEKIYSHDDPEFDPGGPVAARAFFDQNAEAMMAGARVLWPKRESYYDLMEMRLTEGRASFDSEKQNEPVDPSTCFFDVEQFRYWDDQYDSVEALLHDLGSGGHVFGACDPSMGRQGSNRDNTAIVILLHQRATNIYYVLDADIRKRKPSETIQAILAFHDLRGFRRFAIETNQFQEFLKDELERIRSENGVDLHVRGISHSTDKVGRIQSLEPLIATGMLRFSRRHRTLLEELRQFPKAAHDDGPDALQMAVELSRLPWPMITVF